MSEQKISEVSSPPSVDANLVFPLDKSCEGAKIVSLTYDKLNTGLKIPKFVLERTEGNRTSRIDIFPNQEDVNTYEEILKEKI